MKNKLVTAIIIAAIISISVIHLIPIIVTRFEFNSGNLAVRPTLRNILSDNLLDPDTELTITYNLDEYNLETRGGQFTYMYTFFSPWGEINSFRQRGNYHLYFTDVHITIFPPGEFAWEAELYSPTLVEKYANNYLLRDACLNAFPAQVSVSKMFTTNNHILKLLSLKEITHRGGNVTDIYSFQTTSFSGYQYFCGNSSNNGIYVELFDHQGRDYLFLLSGEITQEQIDLFINSLSIDLTDE